MKRGELSPREGGKFRYRAFHRKAQNQGSHNTPKGFSNVDVKASLPLDRYPRESGARTVVLQGVETQRLGSLPNYENVRRIHGSLGANESTEQHNEATG